MGNIQLTVNIITYKIPIDLLQDSLKKIIDTKDDSVLLRVLNNGPSSFTDPIKSQFPDIVWMENGPDCYAMAKSYNRCINTSPSDWAIVCGDDVDFNPGWLEELRKKIDSGCELVGIGFGCFAIRKDIHTKVGACDESKDEYGMDDDDYFFRCIQNDVNMSIVFGPYAINPIPIDAWVHWTSRDPVRGPRVLEARSFSREIKSARDVRFNRIYGSRPGFKQKLDALISEKYRTLGVNKVCFRRVK